MITPHLREQLFTGEDAARSFHEVDEQVELSRREVHGVVAVAHPTGGRLQRDRRRAAASRVGSAGRRSTRRSSA